MKFNRKQLEKLTLEKIDEVNDEAGYRKYLEVPEMVEIIATIMEKKMKVFHDSDAELIQQLRDYANKLEEENEYLSDFKAAAEEELKDWQTCAENLVDYAHEFVQHLSTWGKGYDRYDKDIKKAEDTIEEYLKLKNENQ